MNGIKAQFWNWNDGAEPDDEYEEDELATMEVTALRPGAPTSIAARRFERFLDALVEHDALALEALEYGMRHGLNAAAGQYERKNQKALAQEGDSTW